MDINNVTQEHIDKYVANTKDFWEDSKEVLKSPISIWNDRAEYSLADLIKTFHNDRNGGAYEHFDIIFNTPLLKGEFPCNYIKESGIIVTNFRYFEYSFNCLIIIPFFAIDKIEIIQGNANFKKQIKTVITYSKNGEILKHKIPIKIDNISDIYTRQKKCILNEVQRIIIENTYYDFKAGNPSLTFPKIDWETSLNLIKDYNKTSKDKKSETESPEKNNIQNDSKDINHIRTKNIRKTWLIIIATIIFSGLMFIEMNKENSSVSGNSTQYTKTEIVSGTFVYESSSVKRELRVYGNSWWVKTTEKTLMGNYELDKIDGGDVVNNKLYYDWNKIDPVGRIIDKNTIYFDGKTYKK